MSNPSLDVILMRGDSSREYRVTPSKAAPGRWKVYRASDVMPARQDECDLDGAHTAWQEFMIEIAAGIRDGWRVAPRSRYLDLEPRPLWKDLRAKESA